MTCGVVRLGGAARDDHAVLCRRLGAGATATDSAASLHVLVDLRARALTIAVRLAADVRYGYLVIREGSAAARQDMRPRAFGERMVF